MGNITSRFGPIIGKSLVGGIFLAGTLWPLLFVLPNMPSDLQIYLDATRNFYQGGNPYQPFLIGASFIYPPTAFLLFAPLSWLSDEAATFIFRCINSISYLSSLLILVFLTQPTIKKIQLRGIIFVFLIFSPFIENLVIGQVNSLILLGIVLFILGITDERYRWVGDFSLGFVIAIKISPIILLAYPFFLGDWKRLVRVGVSLLGLIFLSLLFFGIQPWLYFVEVFPALFSSPSSHALTALMDWGLYNTPLSGLDVSWLKRLITLILLTIWVVVILRNRKRSTVLDFFSLGVTTMTIASSLLWYHHFVFLVIPIFYLIIPNEQRTWHKGMANLALIAFLSIQVDRLVTQIIQMPLSSLLGYILVYLLALVNILRFRNTSDVNINYSLKN